jgi:hypothetical protein
LPLLIDAGFVMAGPVVQRTMKKSECHRNVAKIWAGKQRELVGIGTGYSLSEDGLWRQHSWGIRREGILETTVSRVKYFGILLQHVDADSFAMANLARTCTSFGSVKRRTGGREARREHRAGEVAVREIRRAQLNSNRSGTRVS